MKKLVSFVLCALFVVVAAGCATQGKATAIPLPELGVTPDHLVPAVEAEAEPYAKTVVVVDGDCVQAGGGYDACLHQYDWDGDLTSVSAVVEPFIVSGGGYSCQLDEDRPICVKQAQWDSAIFERSLQLASN